MTVRSAIQKKGMLDSARRGYWTEKAIRLFIMKQVVCNYPSQELPFIGFIILMFPSIATKLPCSVAIFMVERSFSAAPSERHSDVSKVLLLRWLRGFRAKPHILTRNRMYRVAQQQKRFPGSSKHARECRKCVLAEYDFHFGSVNVLVNLDAW